MPFPQLRIAPSPVRLTTSSRRSWLPYWKSSSRGETMPGRMTAMKPGPVKGLHLVGADRDTARSALGTVQMPDAQPDHPYGPGTVLVPDVEFRKGGSKTQSMRRSTVRGRMTSWYLLRLNASRMRSAILQMKLFMGLFVSPFPRCVQQGFSFSGTAYYYTWRLSSKKPGRASLATTPAAGNPSTMRA